ncbi:MAG: DUF1844 domain-containing protein [Candidatus Dadabacteria bacterium]|nr:MAG: DUF1844 domain-containing protein [Candidatus Dadabacteria bacterium]
MGDENKEEGQGFKVVDKRRFDSSGQSKAPSSEAQHDHTDNHKAQAGAENLKNSHFPQVNFASFVMSLATQALMQLGEMTPPEGLQVDVDPEAAKQTIDILAMLEEKTKGNLDNNEAQLLEEILHNLRMGYVRKKQS